MKKTFLALLLCLTPFISSGSNFTVPGLPACSNDNYVVTYDTGTTSYSCAAAPTELPACSDDNYVLTYDTGTSLYSCQAAPGAAGGDAWGDPVDADIIPDGDNTRDLGSVAASFNDAHIQGTATIGTATLTAGTVGGSNIATAASTTTFTNKTIDADGSGNSISNIENADIKAAAAIAVNKLAALTASRAVVSDGSGFVSAATTTATEIGYVNGVTSAIQTQINALKVEKITGHLEAPTVKAIILDQNAPYAYTINTIISQCDSGTADFDLEIDGTNVTDCASQQMANSEATDTCSAANVVSAGNTLSLNITAVSSPDDCRFTIKVTRS